MKGTCSHLGHPLELSASMYLILNLNEPFPGAMLFVPPPAETVGCVGASGGAKEDTQGPEIADKPAKFSFVQEGLKCGWDVCGLCVEQ